MATSYNVLRTDFLLRTIEAIKARKLRVFIDPGHGGYDGGANGSVTKESTVVLAVGLLLEKLLIAQGYEVKMSRRTDVFVSLGARAVVANQWGADAFISLHANSATNRTATGFETFIFNNIYSASAKQRAQKLQNHIHDAIAKEIGLRDRGKKAANFQVLRDTAMTSVLLEYGFISNKDLDEKVLVNDTIKMATLTLRGINSFYGYATEYEGGAVAVKPEPNNPKPGVAYEAAGGNHEANWRWATDNKIVNGLNPHGTVTRAQAVTMIKRAMDLK